MFTVCQQCLLFCQQCLLLFVNNMFTVCKQCLLFCQQYVYCLSTMFTVLSKICLLFVNNVTTVCQQYVYCSILFVNHVYYCLSTIFSQQYVCKLLFVNNMFTTVCQQRIVCFHPSPIKTWSITIELIILVLSPTIQWWPTTDLLIEVRSDNCTPLPINESPLTPYTMEQWKWVMKKWKCRLIVQVWYQPPTRLTWEKIRKL